MKYATIVLGFVLALLGIASFVPDLLTNGLLFGFLPVSDYVGIALLVTGGFALMAGFSNPRELEPPRAEGRDLREWVA